MTLCVAVDGSAKPAPSAGKGGLGKRIMAYRAQLAGGELRVETSAAGGTRVVPPYPARRRTRRKSDAGRPSARSRRAGRRPRVRDFPDSTARPPRLKSFRITCFQVIRIPVCRYSSCREQIPSDLSIRLRDRFSCLESPMSRVPRHPPRHPATCQAHRRPLHLPRRPLRADAIWHVDREIASHVARREQAQTQTKLDRVAHQTAAILSELRRYQALAQLNTAASRLQATLGLEPTIAATTDQTLGELTAAVGNSLKAWNAGQLDAAITK